MVTKAQLLSARRSPFYRAGQFFRALTARPLTASEREEVAAVLTPAQQALFRRMRRPDQRHSLLVQRTVVEMGYSDRELLAAALLHDVGKSCFRLRLWEQPAVVLIRMWRPAVVQQWGAGEPRGWRRPFVVYEQHPEWGAEMATAAGCSALTVWLVRHHQTEPHPGREREYRFLRALQHADSKN